VVEKKEEREKKKGAPPRWNSCSRCLHSLGRGGGGEKKKEGGKPGEGRADSGRSSHPVGGGRGKGGGDGEERNTARPSLLHLASPPMRGGEGEKKKRGDLKKKRKRVASCG